MVIYAEYLFAENVITGGIILLLTGHITGLKVKLRWLILGSILCGLYAFVLFWDPTYMWMAILSKVAFSVLLVKLVFHVKLWRPFLRTLLIFYLISLSMGGITIGVVYFMQFSGVTRNSAIYMDGFTYLQVTSGCLITYLIFRFVASFLKERITQNRTMAKVRITCFDKQLEVKGLVDTGNFLTDPMTGKPVLVLSAQAARNILPEEMITVLDQKGTALSAYEQLMESSFSHRIRLIPFRSIGEDQGFLLGIMPDAIYLQWDAGQGGGVAGTVKMEQNTVLAIYRGTFTGENTDEGYSILLHPSVVEGGIACNG